MYCSFRWPTVRRHDNANFNVNRKWPIVSISIVTILYYVHIIISINSFVEYEPARQGPSYSRFFVSLGQVSSWDLRWPRWKRAVHFLHTHIVDIRFDRHSLCKFIWLKIAFFAMNKLCCCFCRAQKKNKSGTLTCLVKFSTRSHLHIWPKPGRPLTCHYQTRRAATVMHSTFAKVTTEYRTSYVFARKPKKKIVGTCGTVPNILHCTHTFSSSQRGEQAFGGATSIKKWNKNEKHNASD